MALPALPHLTENFSIGFERKAKNEVGEFLTIIPNNRIKALWTSYDSVFPASICGACFGIGAGWVSFSLGA